MLNLSSVVISCEFLTSPFKECNLSSPSKSSLPIKGRYSTIHSQHIMDNVLQGARKAKKRKKKLRS